MSLSQTRWPFFIALVAGVSAVALVSCFVLSNRTGEAQPATGGTYVEAVTRPPERINPLFASANQTDGDLSALVFSGLIRLSADGTPLPDLAERWEINNNGQGYVFHLRRGVEWHDGESFSADDVLFTFKAIADPGFKGDRALAELMRGVVVTARDPETVEFKLEQAYSPFLAYLTVGIVPRHLLAGLDANQLFNAPFNANPIGTGPYAFVSRDESNVRLRANDTYYLGPPRISTMQFGILPDNDAVAAALRERNVDGALLDPDTSDAEIDYLRNTGDFTLHPLISTAYNIIYFNTRTPPLNDLGVRTALRSALNLQTIVDDLDGGRGVPAGAGISSSSWAYSSFNAPEFDADAAATALDKAGWTAGSDGVRRKGDTPLAFNLSTPNDADRVALANSIAVQWQSLGVDVTVQPLAASSFIDDYLLPHKFDAALAVIDPGPDPDPYPFWHSSQIATPGRNLSQYSDSGIDTDLEQARQTSDSARRKTLYLDFAKLLVGAAPAIPLFAPESTYVISSRVRGYDESLLFTPASRFTNVSAWYIHTRIR